MHVLVQRAGNFFSRGTGLPRAVRKNQPLVFLHNHHVYLKKLHRGVTRSATASSQPLPTFTTSYSRETWVSALTQYAPSGPLTLLPAACGEEVPYAGMS